MLQLLPLVSWQQAPPAVQQALGAMQVGGFAD
jgi:hypothetical protein